jgi:hypothetical protein
MLFAMPVLDVLLGVGSPGAVHLIVGTSGAALIALSKKTLARHHGEPSTNRT